MKNSIIYKENLIDELMRQNQMKHELVNDRRDKLHKKEEEGEKIRSELREVKRNLRHVGVDLEYFEKQRSKVKRKNELKENQQKMNQSELESLKKKNKELLDINTKVNFFITFISFWQI